MEVNATAQQYGLALFEAAMGKAEIISENLQKVKDTLAESNDFSLFFASPKVPASIKKSILQKTFSGKIDELALNVLLLLIDNHRETLIPDVIEYFVLLTDESLGRIRVDVTLAKQFSDADLKNISEEVEKTILAKKESFGITGNNLEIIVKTKVKDDILGGAIIRTGDFIWDASVRTYIQNWKHNIYNKKLKNMEHGWVKVPE